MVWNVGRQEPKFDSVVCGPFEVRRSKETVLKIVWREGLLIYEEYSVAPVIYSAAKTRQADSME